MSSARVVNGEKRQFYNRVNKLFDIRIQHLQNDIQIFFVLAHPLVNDVFRQMTFNHFPHQTVYRATDSSNLL